MTETIEHQPANRMPGQIGRALLRIMAKVKPANQSEKGDNGRTWSSADDVFEAVQPAMAAEGLILELFDAGCDFPTITVGGELVTAIHMRFRPVLSWFDLQNAEAAPAYYENPEIVLHVVAMHDGQMGRTSAFRTLAEKTHIRALLKLPTSAADKAEAEGIGASVAAAPASASVPPPENVTQLAAPGGKKPGRLTKAESARARETMLEALNIASDNAPKGDEAARIAAVSKAWKTVQADFGKLLAPDQDAIKQARTKLITPQKTQAGKVA